MWRVAGLLLMLFSVQAAAQSLPYLVLDKAVIGSNETVSLPHRWDRAYPQQAGQLIYVLDLAIEPQKLEAVFIPRVGNQAQITLIVSGKRFVLARLGVLGDVTTDSSKAPHWVSIPSGIVTSDTAKGATAAGAVQLEVIISAQSGRYGGLSKVYAGKADALKPLYQRDYRWRQTSTVVIVLSLGLMGFIALGIWMRQREVVFGVFAVAALLGMLRMADRIWVAPPLAWPLWGGVAAAAYGCHLLLLARLAIEVAQRWQAQWNRIFRVGLTLVAISGVGAFIANLPQVWTATLVLLMFPGGFSVYSLGREFYRSRSRESGLVLLASIVVLGAGIRDFVLVRVAANNELTYSVLPHAVLLLVVAMGWIVVDRYANQVRRYRQLNASLAQTLAEREKALSESFEVQKKQSESNAMLQERARIMRDIHDGVGAQLVGLLQAVKTHSRGDLSAASPSEIESLASTALDELRMAVDSLQPVNGDIATVLATLRYRLQPRLNEAGIEVIWKVDDIPTIDSLTPSAVLDIQRILLEAFTNVIRHARASKLQVSSGVTEGGQEGQPRKIYLQVEDDGIGISQGVTQGHGLQNLALRSKAVGAQFFIGQSRIGEASKPGTCIRLEWPTEA